MKIKRELYKNGAIVRIKNKRISFKETGNGVFVCFEFATKENNDLPTCSCKVIKNRLRITHIKLTHEAMQELAMAYLKYQHLKTDQ